MSKMGDSESTEERTDQENVSPRTESVNPMSGDTRSTEKQLRDEIDRLKLALEESGAYAARLKTELDTLKDTNAKLSATLEEKTSTVKELNVQLANYKSRISQMEEMVERQHGQDDRKSQLENISDTVSENISDAASKDISDAVDEDIVHQLQPFLLETSGEMIDYEAVQIPPPPSREQSILIHGSENITVAKTVINTTVVQEPSSGYESNFKGQMDTIVKTFQAKDHLYVETAAFKELKEDLIRDQSWAIILGKPGDGKTAMAAHLMLQYMDEGYEPIFLTSAEDWKTFIVGEQDCTQNRKQFVIIDDMFGSSNVDKTKVREWMALFEIMERVIKERKGKLCVVCTSRRHIYYDVKSQLAKFNCNSILFKETSVVDLSSKQAALSNEEKTTLYENYSQEYNVQGSYNVRWIVGANPPHGFPHCVELFCTNAFFRDEQITFFKNPIQFILNEVQNFKDNDPVKYCVLLLVLYKNNRLSLDDLHDIPYSMTDEDRRIFGGAGDPKSFRPADLNKALNALMNIYIHDNGDGTLSFSHESIYENVLFSCINDHPAQAIEKMSLQYVNIFTAHRSFHSLCYSSKALVDALMRRLMTEIENGNVVAACENYAWGNKEFIHHWVNFVQNKLQNPSESFHFFLIKDTTNEWNTGYTLLEALVLFDKTEVVRSLSTSRTIVDYFHKESSRYENIVPSAVYLACVAVDSNTLEALLKFGTVSEVKDELGRDLIMRVLEQPSGLPCAKILLDRCFQRHLGSPRKKCSDNRGKGYFHYLCKRPLSSYELEIGYYRSMCSILLKLHEDINMKDETGKTPLFECIQAGSADKSVVIIKILLSLGADIDARDFEGRNIASYTLSQTLEKEDYSKYVKCLDSAGADFCSVDERLFERFSYP